MAFDEEAKAVQEAAKASGKAIDAAREAGGFLARFVEGPLSTAAEMLNDRLKYARWERQQRLAMRAEQFLKDAGSDGPTRTIALNVAVPLLEAATLEEDDELQDAWAAMLVNAADVDSGIEIRRMFISILQDMNSLEVRCMEKIVSYHDPRAANGSSYLLTHMLPDHIITSKDVPAVPVPTESVTIALRNLMRLGCVDGVMMVGGITVRAVSPTELGIALVKACTLKRTR